MCELTRAKWHRAPLPGEIQRRLMDYYGLDELPDVEPFVELRDDVDRERVIIRDSGGMVELRVELPADSVAPRAELSLDKLCQVVEGVSHFLLIAERARRELPTTQLELELQAEVDKFVLLGVALDRPLGPAQLAWLRRRLFARARFIDPPGSERGERYRMAHRLAERFIHKLDRRYLRRQRLSEVRQTLQHFYQMGQTSKIALTRAA